MSKEEMLMIRDMEKNAQELRESLENGLKLLNEAETTRATPDDVKKWLRELKDFVFEADNILDELNYLHLSEKSRHGTAKLPTCIPLNNQYPRLRGVALRIKEINGKFSYINRNATVLLELENAPALINRSRRFPVGRESMERDQLLTIDPPKTVLETLSLCLDNLSSPSLIKCFANCSIFPKGHRILKQTIIELWMAEGFLQSNDMESVGNNFFNILLHNRLLQAAERDEFGNVESCVMHGLVHDLASSVLGSSDGTNRVRYMYHDGDEDSSPIPDDVAGYLRTVIIRVRGNITDATMFSSFKSLHVLTLDCDQVTRFPSSFSKLIHLRNLNISRTRIEYLPDWISEFYYLQTLNASTDSLRALPCTFMYLISLRHLYLPSHVKLPEIGRFINLRALKFRVGDQKGYKIKELGSLKNLRQVHILNVENVHNKRRKQNYLRSKT